MTWDLGLSPGRRSAAAARPWVCAHLLRALGRPQTRSRTHGTRTLQAHLFCSRKHGAVRGRAGHFVAALPRPRGQERHSQRSNMGDRSRLDKAIKLSICRPWRVRDKRHSRQSCHRHVPGLGPWPRRKQAARRADVSLPLHLVRSCFRHICTS
jgi:hypothetical protein